MKYFLSFWSVHYLGIQRLVEITNKWKDKAQIDIDLIRIVSRSFYLHHSSFRNSYLKCTHSQTLHRIICTNGKLFKMGIKRSDCCVFCKSDPDNLDHV